jgi:phosphate:Na+ symporter
MFENRSEITMVIDGVSTDDDKIDGLDKAIRFYLAKLIQEKLSGEQSTMQIQLLSITTDLEDVGDIISKDLATLAQKRKSKASLFSAEGWADITRMHKLVKENFDLMLSILVSPSKELEKTLERHESNMLKIEDDLRRAHLTRLHEGIKDAFDTSSIHLDILGNYGRINSKLTHIARRAISTQQ